MKKTIYIILAFLVMLSGAQAGSFSGSNYNSASVAITGGKVKIGLGSYNPVINTGQLGVDNIYFNSDGTGVYNAGGIPIIFSAGGGNSARIGGAGVFDINDVAGNNTIARFSAAGISNGVKLTIAKATPTIASGFGTGASIVSANGTAAFLINVGTGAIGAGVITMPAASNGWVCSIGNNFASANAITQVDSSTTTSVTISNYLVSTGVNTAWTSGRVLQVKCMGY